MSLFSKSTVEELKNKLGAYDSQTADLNIRVGELKRKMAQALLQEDPAAGELRKDLANSRDELEARQIGRAALERELRSAQRRARLAAINQDKKTATDWLKALGAGGEKLRAAIESLDKRWEDFFQAAAEIPPLFKGSRRPAPMFESARLLMAQFFSVLADAGYPPRDDPKRLLAGVNKYLGTLIIDLNQILEELNHEQQGIVDEEEAADRDPLAPPDEGQVEAVVEAP